MVVLITGASSKIGYETALKFASNGYDVIIHYYKNETKACELLEKVKNIGVDGIKIEADLSKEEDIKKMFDTIKDKYSKIDCIINNAAVAKDTLPFEKSVDDFKHIFDINVIGVYLVCKYAACMMNNGSIVNISSNTALNAYYPYGLDYDVSKAGVISLTHNLSIVFAPMVRVNTVALGWVNTDMNKDMSSEFKKEEEKKILLKRFAEPNEVANVIYFLCSKEASYINNSIIRVDGGTYGSC